MLSSVYKPLRSNFIHLAAIASSIFALSLLWGVPFICMDDMYTAFARLRYGGIWSASKELAFSTGRFYQLIYYTLTQLPYNLFHSLPSIYMARMIVPALTFGVFWLLIFRVFRSKRFASLTVLFFATFIEATSGYNSFHSLIWWFNLGWLFCLLGMIAYQRGIEQNKARLFWFAAVSFGFGMMAYESLLLYGVIFPLIWLNEGRKLGRAFIKSVAPLVLVYTLYILAYFSFRKISGGTYAGTAPSMDSPRRILKTIWLFTRHGFIIDLPHPRNWAGFSRSAIAMGVIFGAGCLSYLATPPKENPKLSRYVRMAAIIFPLAFLSNVLYGFIERYRSWAEGGPIYHGNYFSAFFLALTFAFLFSLLFFTWNNLQKKSLAFLAVFILSLYAIRAMDINSGYFSELRATAPVWKNVNEDIAKGLFDSIKPHEKVQSKYLTTLPYLNPTVYNYWDFYVQDATDKRPEFVLPNKSSVDGEMTIYEVLPSEHGQLTYLIQRLDKDHYQTSLSAHENDVDVRILDSDQHWQVVHVKNNEISRLVVGGSSPEVKLL